MFHNSYNYSNITSSKSIEFDFNNGTSVSCKSYEYKILAQKDKLFSGKFDPENLELAINAYAQQGWRAISCSTSDISGFGKKRQEFVVVFERQVR